MRSDEDPANQDLLKPGFLEAKISWSKIPGARFLEQDFLEPEFPEALDPAALAIP
ncbi:hypothetical protein ABIB80_003511 [Bradyrhizobium sp. i1.15.2]|uniref:hypothetical protein n=1 Tax=Bradyrhizobium sp. i1.15.2 TaxID=3156362 RepID=UPI003390AFE3